MIRSTADLANSVEELYRVFAHYKPGRVTNCTYCWSKDEIEALLATPLRTIAPELARQLLWESADHWESAEAYKYFLPRILEAMTPALSVEDMYPQHIFETLRALGFGTWHGAENEAVLRFLRALEAMLPSVPGLQSESAQAEWRIAVESLRRLSIAPLLLEGPK